MVRQTKFWSFGLCYWFFILLVFRTVGFSDQCRSVGILGCPHFAHYNLLNKHFFLSFHEQTIFPTSSWTNVFSQKIACPQESNGQPLMQIMNIRPIEKPKFCSLKPVGKKITAPSIYT